MHRKNKFLEMSIRSQMKIIAFIVLAFFTLLFGLITVSIRQMVFRNEDEHMQVTALRLRDQIELTYEKIGSFCVNIGEDPAVQALLRSDHTEIFTTFSDVTDCLTRYKVLEPMIEDISLVNSRIHYSNVYRNVELDEIRAQVHGAPFCWLGLRSHNFAADSGKADMMVYAGDVTVNAENIGTVILSVDALGFFEEESSEQNQIFFLADADGVVFPFSRLGESAEDVYRVWLGNDRTEHMENSEYYIHSYYLEEMNCHLVSALHLKESGAGMARTQTLIWMCFLQAAVFCFAFFLLITRGIVRPIRQFGGAIKHIRESHRSGLESELNLRGCAEISELGHEFSVMMNDIEQLNRQVIQSATDLYELKVQKQEAELAYLRSQVDPHFLYNTLEVLRKMALEKNAPEIAQMAMDMGNIFRYNAKGGDEVSLEEEFSIVKSYIHIQQMRFGSKIEVYYFIPEDVLHLKVMKMLLQPIVENAIFHGLEPQRREGSLYIGARKENETLVITVKDDGVGIEREQLEELQRELSDETMDTSKHVGTLNTNARIRLFYGKGYGVSIDSCVEDGTTVILRLPARPMDR